MMTMGFGRRFLLAISLASGLAGASPAQEPAPSALATVAEKSGFTATASHAEVSALCQALDARSDLVNAASLGRSAEGRDLPVLIVADPPIRTAEEARASGKLRVLLLGNIHAGEVCGKEALPMLVRELTDQPHHPLLRDLVILAAPIFNADGNERVSTTNRPGQVGPEKGMGQRPNAQGLDLNRDFMKLDSPEVRGLVAFLNGWDPHIVVDTHTTNGSAHRFLITYEGPKNPAGDDSLIRYARESFLPAVTKRLKSSAQIDSFFYGNFENDHADWTSYPAEPRYGTTYVGLRNRLGILCEAYAYAPYEARVRGTLAFVKDVLAHAASESAAIQRLIAAADERVIHDTPSAASRVPIRSSAVAFEKPITILGFEEEIRDGKPHATTRPRDYTARLVQDFQPTESVARPRAYLLPPDREAVAQKLRDHGIEVRRIEAPATLPAESYRVVSARRSPRGYQGHNPVALEVEPQTGPLQVGLGWFLVPTAQRLGNLAVYLLEPRSDDSLAFWDLMGPGIEPGATFPAHRVIDPAVNIEATLLASNRGPQANPAPEPAAPAQEAPKTEPRPILNLAELQKLGGGMAGPLGGGSTRWLDAEHWLEARGGRLLKVNARTGESSPFFDPAKMAEALAKLPAISDDDARTMARRTSFDMDPQHQGALIEHENDLYYATFDGSKAVRLTETPEAEELAEFSPSGKLVAFVRSNDLWVVDIDSQKERALTTGGSDVIRHGKAVWVYFEEIFNRSWKAFWWSPDSAHIAYLELDDRPLQNHHVLDDTAARRKVEETPYPFAGEPNPRVKVLVVSAAGGSPVAADLSAYSPDDLLISHVGWTDDGSSAIAQAQNRTQTWLDVLRVDPHAGTTTRLFRDQTKAWTEALGDLKYLDDKSILFLSERSGWKHLYRAGADGSEAKPITSGEWEVRSIAALDPKAGVAYITATKDSPIAENLYRVKLDDGAIERLSIADGAHTISLSPDRSLFVDRWSSHASPNRSALYSAADGSLIRVLDASPLGPLERFKVGERKLVKIPTRDGYELEGEIILPPDLDPSKKYAVWFQTYAGPHFPSVSDAWLGGRLQDHAIAGEGIIGFRMDPRSASGKGASSAWVAYRQLGVKETEDITDAIEWLKKTYPVDPERIGMSGHSYGGYITAYAMTHTKLFSCGIAGAPVTDWRNYDSIYTERYMSTPQDNPQGYDASSVVKAARDLHGHLLIVHGAKDDNVSIRNSYQLIHALQNAGKDFELMVYPSARHGIFSPHYTRLRADFIRKHLGGGPRPRERAE